MPRPSRGISTAKHPALIQSGFRANPKLLRSLPGLQAIETALAEKSLSEYIRQAWHVVEPTTPYIGGWHIDIIIEHLEALYSGQIKRLLINVPPRHMKSLMCSVFFPTWAWLQRPSLRFLFASYAQDLSVRDSLKCRRLVTSPWYQSRWGDRYQLTGDQNQKMRFENNHTGYRLATSVDGVLTGEGGDIIVVDDPHNVRRASSVVELENTLRWWDEAMQTRLNDPSTGRIMMIMQRVHEGDLSGHILEKGGYVHLCLPARYEGMNRIKTTLPAPHEPYIDPRTAPGEPLWPELYGDEELKLLERDMGSYAVACQLQQRPAPREGGYLKRAWLPIVEAAPKDVVDRIRRWDFAATEKKKSSPDPDYTCGALCSLGKDGIFYIEDIVRFRGTPLAVEQTLQNVALLDKSTFGHVKIYIEQEPGSSGIITVEHYTRNVLPGYGLRGERSTHAKEVYVDKFAAAAEAGNVRLVRGAWNRAFIEEAELFPNGTHDDQIDPVSKAYVQMSIRPALRARVV